MPRNWLSSTAVPRKTRRNPIGTRLNGELTGESDTDPKDALLESAPESERWDPVHGSTGQKVPVAPNEDEDEEGRSDSERLVEEGVLEAEHDQMLKATRTQRSADES